jgi:transcription antitermination factor NusG
MSSNKRWYAVYTKPRWEKKIHRLLQEKQIESYCPLNRVHRRWSDRIKVVQEPLFKSYVFVRIADADKSAVRMVEGVVNFVYWLGKPAIIKDKEIEVIRQFLNEYQNIEVQPVNNHIEPGNKVMVERGILMGRKGIVRQVLHNRVELLIESIGFMLIAHVDKSKITLLDK